MKIRKLPLFIRYFIREQLALVGEVSFFNLNYIFGWPMDGRSSRLQLENKEEEKARIPRDYYFGGNKKKETTAGLFFS